MAFHYHRNTFDLRRKLKILGNTNILNLKVLQAY